MYFLMWIFIHVTALDGLTDPEGFKGSSSSANNC